jgi:hypothetical protein
MRKGYVHFVRGIYTYCDKHVGEKALFPVFTNFWDENGEAEHVSRRDLAILTSKIICKLLERKVFVEIPKDTKFHTPYGLYKILPHENLMRYDELFEKKSQLAL